MHCGCHSHRDGRDRRVYEVESLDLSVLIGQTFIKIFGGANPTAKSKFGRIDHKLIDAGILREPLYG